MSHHDVLMTRESLIGVGNKVAYVDILTGQRGSVGIAFAILLELPYRDTEDSAIIAPNLVVKPPTVIVPTMTIKKRLIYTAPPKKRSLMPLRMLSRREKRKDAVHPFA